MEAEVTSIFFWDTALRLPPHTGKGQLMFPALKVESPPVKPDTPEKAPEKEPVEPGTEKDPGLRPVKCPEDSPCPMPD